MLNNRTKKGKFGELLITFAAVLWGIVSLFTLPLNKMGFSAFQISFLRCAFAALVFAIYFLIKDVKLFKVSVKDLPILAATGIVGFLLLLVFYMASIEENGSSVAAMFLYTSPVWTFVFAKLFFKENVTFFKVLSLIGVLCGCVMVSVGGALKLTVKGLLLGVASGLTQSLYVIFNKAAGSKYAATTTVFYTFLFAAVGAAFFAKIWEIPKLVAADYNSLFYIAGASIVVTVLAYCAYTAGLKTVSAGKANIISIIELIVATVIGVACFGNELGVSGYLGIAIMIAALVLLEVKGEKPLIPETVEKDCKTDETNATKEK